MDAPRARDEVEQTQARSDAALCDLRFVPAESALVAADVAGGVSVWRSGATLEKQREFRIPGLRPDGGAQLPVEISGDGAAEPPAPIRSVRTCLDGRSFIVQREDGRVYLYSPP